MHKDTYMFVTPTFIKQYAGDLLSVEEDAQYSELVQFLSEVAAGNPEVVNLNNVSDPLNPTVVSNADSLTAGMQLMFTGINFGTSGSLTLGGTKVPTSGWSETAVSFTLPASAVSDTAKSFELTPDGAVKPITFGSYAVSKASSNNGGGGGSHTGGGNSGGGNKSTAGNNKVATAVTE